MDIETFERAVGDPQPKIAAWDLNVRDGRRALSIFSLAAGGAKQVAWREVAEGAEAPLTEELRARGLDVGGYDYFGPFVWHVAPDRVRVWDKDALVLTAEGDTLTSYNRPIARAELTSFIAYAADDYVDRGVKVGRADGRRTTVLYEISLSAQADPTYSRNELLMSTAWCNTVAHALAEWAGVAYVDEI